MTLRAAKAQDFPFIRALVQRPENAPFVSDEDETILAGYTTDPTSRLLIWGADAPRGFAIFCDIGDPSGTVNLMRLALDVPGRGEGAAFLHALIDYAFGTLNAQRLWLDTAGENLRAQRAYVRAGFTLEGHLRQHVYHAPVGQVQDVLLYGMLRTEWDALPR
jgi:RimJ/RimL family protein N-acetyltransferase